MSLAPALDPAHLFRAAGLEPDEWQRDVLLESWDRALLNVTRQGGKSLTVAALALHAALYQSEALVLILAPSRRQSKETLQKAFTLYRASGRPVPIENRSELRARFDNGSRIIALPGTEKTVRGFSAVDLLIADEAARVPGELYRTVRPMLAVSGGRLVALSTPRGRRGWFYESWTGEQEWKRVKVTAKECDRITDEFLLQERRELPESWFLSEYMCRFTDTVDSAFAMEDVDEMESTVPALFSASDPAADTSEEIPTI